MTRDAPRRARPLALAMARGVAASGRAAPATARSAVAPVRVRPTVAGSAASSSRPAVPAPTAGRRASTCSRPRERRQPGGIVLPSLRVPPAVGPRRRGAARPLLLGPQHRRDRAPITACAQLRRPPGQQVDPAEVDATSCVKGAHGDGVHVHAGRAALAQVSRVVPPSATGCGRSSLRYTVQDVRVKGANVVNAAQQRFRPSETPSFPVQVLLYAARFKTRDAFFGFPLGSAVALALPRRARRSATSSTRTDESVLRPLPRSDYEVTRRRARALVLAARSHCRATRRSSSRSSALTSSFVIVVVGLLAARWSRARRRPPRAASAAVGDRSGAPLAWTLDMA